MISDAFEGENVLDSWRNINWQILSRRKKFMKILQKAMQLTSNSTFKTPKDATNMYNWITLPSTWHYHTLLIG